MDVPLEELPLEGPQCLLNIWARGSLPGQTGGEQARATPQGPEWELKPNRGSGGSAGLLTGPPTELSRGLRRG